MQCNTMQYDTVQYGVPIERKEATEMALTNFILTVAGVGAVVLLLKGDVKQSASIFRRNVKHIRNWLEEESSAASK